VDAITHGEFLAMDFPQRLVELRKARNLTQAGLSELAGVHLTQIQRYESGASQPTLEIIKNLAIGLSVSADLLLFDQEERGPDDKLRLHFEAVRQFDEEDRHIIEGLLEAMILKHQNKRFFQRNAASAARPSRSPPRAAPDKRGTKSRRAAR
jgi:transcriptional regulator with XRE-family HTH domain